MFVACYLFSVLKSWLEWAFEHGRSIYIANGTAVPLTFSKFGNYLHIPQHITYMYKIFGCATVTGILHVKNLPLALNLIHTVVHNKLIHRSQMFAIHLHHRWKLDSYLLKSSPVFFRQFIGTKWNQTNAGTTINAIIDKLYDN